jgi:superfamily II DNA or RNA helicase
MKITVLKISLRYDKGTIIITGLTHIPFATFDPRNNILRAQALYYVNIVEYLRQSKIEFTDNVFCNSIASPDLRTNDSCRNNNNDDGYSDDRLSEKNEGHGRPPPVSFKAETSTLALTNASDATTNSTNDSFIALRDYQQEAVKSWIRAGQRGCIVMPTGSGKSMVAIEAIATVNASSLVVVPTLDLMDQWTSLLSKHFQSTEIGNLGGGIDDIQPITVSTYDSAYLRAPLLGDKFSLVVFDEVHHLAAPGYRTIAEQMAAPYRLGLTATIEREDELHRDLPRLVGEIVYQASIATLAKDNHIASYEIERRKVDLLPDELAEYRNNMSIYRRCLNMIGERRRTLSTPIKGDYDLSLEKLIIMSGRNPIAREALLARNKANGIAFNSRAKIEELKEILAESPGKKTIIFTQHNRMVYQISDKFLIPFITHRTSKDERQDVLKRFKDGEYRAIVTSKVLDEGVDVPDAELGVIVSGTGSSREFIQRLGRLLRPKPNGNGGDGAGTNKKKKARLIEIISSETREETITSAKRKRALRSIR